MAFFTNDATRKIVEEVTNDVYQLVCSTMGPEGRLIAIQFGESSKTTKDGVTVAKSISYDNIERSMIARMITEASIQTDLSCGDGTTTTVFLTHWLFNSFKDNFSFRSQRHLDKLIKEAIELVKGHVHTVHDVNDEVLRMLAMTTSNNDSVIVDKVLDIYRNSKAEPYISVIEGSSQDDIVEVAEGVSINGGYAHPSFSPQGTGNPIAIKSEFIPIIVDKDVTLMSCKNVEEHIRKLTDELIEQNKLIIIFCRSMDNNICNIVHTANKVYSEKCKEQNKQINGGIIVVAVDAQGSVGSGIMSDVAMLLNSEPHPDFDTAMFDFKASCNTELVIGSRSIGVTKLTDEMRENITKHVSHIDETIKSLGAGQQDSVVARILRKRKRSLVGGSVKIFVGGDVQSDIRERMDRFTDVIEAVKSALEGGVIPGCGSVLLKVGQEFNQRYPDDEIAKQLARVFARQYCHLMSVDSEDFDDIFSKEALGQIEYTNLATGEVASNPGVLGIYDTAEALLNALRAGYKTSTLLINLSGILLGNNLSKKEFKIG